MVQQSIEEEDESTENNEGKTDQSAEKSSGNLDKENVPPAAGKAKIPKKRKLLKAKVLSMSHRQNYCKVYL